MIKNFADNETYHVFLGEGSGKLPDDIHERARTKLLFLNSACTPFDLRNPPSNHLERLHGDRKGQYSIRINQQWRICFKWKDGHATHVEIVDYH